ncbi:hypothetical protein [Clostridium chrysemydis]|uniref:hypothetical protein n=1 Tax=Clostridium chrysemydis TaxID=2665504 RepID=UPI001883D40B|nr:hypothetical protein [Clostridium chrysemydis]
MTYNIKKIDSLYEYLRKSKCIAAWKKASFRASNKKCAVTRRVNDLEIHHLHKPFIAIVRESLEELGLEEKWKVHEYSQEELLLIQLKVKDLHKKYGPGVVMHKRIHSLLHKEYGMQPTKEEFYEFKRNFLNKKYSTVCK